MAIMYTGGAGRMGTVIRAGLEGGYPDVRLLVKSPGTRLLEGETEFVGDLADLDLLTKVCSDVDTVVHLGGIADERSFPEILENNIVGTYNLFEAARRAKVRRVIFASSNHAMGFYPSDTKIEGLWRDARSPISRQVGPRSGFVAHRKLPRSTRRGATVEHLAQPPRCDFAGAAGNRCARPWVPDRLRCVRQHTRILGE